VTVAYGPSLFVTAAAAHTASPIVACRLVYATQLRWQAQLAELQACSAELGGIEAQYGEQAAAAAAHIHKQCRDKLQEVDQIINVSATVQHLVDVSASRWTM
jgi:hypothetical protein